MSTRTNRTAKKPRTEQQGNPNPSTVFQSNPLSGATQTRTAASPKSKRRGNPQNLIPQTYGGLSKIKAQNLPPTFQYGDPSITLSKRASNPSPNARNRKGNPKRYGVAQSDFADDLAAINAFLQENPDCADQAEIERFLGLVQQGRTNGIDVIALARTEGLSRQAQSRGIYSGIGRYASAAFDPVTLGANTNTKRGKKELPSLLWAILSRECGYVDQLNNFIENILNKEGVPEVEYVAKDPVTPEQQTKRNKEIANFIAARPGCAASEAQIRQFLNLIDSYHLNAQNVLAIFRTAGLHGDFGTFKGKSGIEDLRRPSMRGRSADLTLEPYTKGVRGKDKVKYSFLWDMLQRYCGQLDQVLNIANAALQGALDTKMKQ